MQDTCMQQVLRNARWVWSPQCPLRPELHGQLSSVHWSLANSGPGGLQYWRCRKKHRHKQVGDRLTLAYVTPDWFLTWSGIADAYQYHSWDAFFANAKATRRKATAASTSATAVAIAWKCLQKHTRLLRLSHWFFKCRCPRCEAEGRSFWRRLSPSAKMFQIRLCAASAGSGLDKK